MIFTPTLIRIAAAVIPAVWLLIRIYRADRLEKEPAALLGLLLLHGIVATALAAYAERIGYSVLSALMDEDSLGFQLVTNFLVVGLAEEGFKYLLLKRRTWNSPHFNCQFDAVVYAVFISLGFALWENISYVALYGLDVALIRAVTAVPGHASFGVFMGAWYGLAKAHERRGNEENSRICRRIALICPVLLHGLYDFIATLENPNAVWYFVAFIAVVFLIAYGMVRKLSRQDQYI